MNFNNRSILVVGDVMLDQYWFGHTARISPEAPVPVVRVNRMHERPGGAANVALGIAALGAKPYLLGLVGEDQASETLKKLLQTANIHCELQALPGIQTINKLRVVSRNQQMIRLDREDAFALENNPVQHQTFRNSFLTLLNEVEMLVLSDYGKGTLADAPWLIAKAKEKGIPVIIDPKSTDFSVYQAATIITPNMKEFEAVVGNCDSEAMMIEKAKALLTCHAIDTLVITRSEQGMSVITQAGTLQHIPAVAREVHDVTGAGDTVIAVLATALASGHSLWEAANLSNIAAGIAVGKLGAATVSCAELQMGLHPAEDKIMTGVMTEETLMDAVHHAKKRGEKIVFTNGCFDILHAGHVLYLEEAKRLGDRVIVAVNTDDSVRRLKGQHRPINPLEDRLNVLAGLKSVDWVLAFSEDTPERLIREISPHVLVKGGDYQTIENLPGASHVLSQGGSVKLLGLKENRSTTHLIHHIYSKAIGETVK